MKPSIVDEIMRLDIQGIQFFLDGNEVKITGPEGAITRDILESVRNRKAEIREYLIEAEARMVKFRQGKILECFTNEDGQLVSRWLDPGLAGVGENQLWAIVESKI